MKDSLLALDKRLRLITALSYFSTKQSFREIAHRHGIADSTAHAHVEEVTQALVVIAPRIIK